jgi:hypothetical protein
VYTHGKQSEKIGQRVRDVSSSLWRGWKEWEGQQQETGYLPKYLLEIEENSVGGLEGGEKGNGVEVLLSVPGW